MTGGDWPNGQTGGYCEGCRDQAGWLYIPGWWVWRVRSETILEEQALHTSGRQFHWKRPDSSHSWFPERPVAKVRFQI